MELILASKSPRRKELLEMCNVNFLTEVSEIDERSIEKEIVESNSDKTMFEKADLLTSSLAFNKAKAVSESNPNKIVIGSDTVVVSSNEILGKPESKEDAYRMLKSLCGATHRVYTGVSLVKNGTDLETFTSYTEVEFFDFDEDMDNLIKEYIETGSPMDKAGAYGIQDMGALLIKRISGDYYTVMGLPISQLYRSLLAYQR